MNSPGRQVLKGYGSFPDIVILSENFDVTKSQKENLDCLLGCIEAKTEINGDKYAMESNGYYSKKKVEAQKRKFIFHTEK